MAFLRVASVAVLANLAAAGNVVKHREDPANGAKMAAVNKVVELLEKLQSDVTAEGEKEAATYNKFACFCKDVTAEKTEAISSGTDAKDALIASIEALNTKRGELDAEIAGYEAEIAEAEGEIKTAEESRQTDLATYQTNEADLSGAVEALNGAIAALKASKGPALVQLQTFQPTLRQALIIADALGLGGAATTKATALLLQQPTQDYDFHAGSIIDTLETLLGDFKTQKNTLDADEVKAITDHQLFVQEKTDLIKSKTTALQAAQTSKAQKQAEIATDSQQLTIVAATLLDDQEYLQGLSSMCSAKAKAWDQRSQVRSEEIAALTAATAIIKDTVGAKTSAATVRLAQQAVTVNSAEAVAHSEDAMEAVEAATEVAEGRSNAVIASFLQVSRSRNLRASRGFEAPAAYAEAGRQAALALLRSRSAQLKSAALATLVSQLSEDPLAKVKTLIQEMVEHLLAEENTEANQKAWCDKSISEAETKRDGAASSVEQLNGSMAALEALRDSLATSIAALTKEIEDLEASAASAKDLRDKEKEQNEAAVTEATEGLAAVNEAIDVLSKFYKTAAKAVVEELLVKKAVVVKAGKKNPAEDAPDAGFDEGEAYTGSQAASGGVLGMMDVIAGDFQRTIDTVQAAEAKAEQDYLAFSTETEKSLAEKRVAKEDETRQKDDAEEKLASDSESLTSQTSLLQSAVEELIKLKETCIDTGMSYEERVAARADELAALKKALCIFENYASYGPSSKADQC